MGRVSWITTAEAARLLQVKPATLYAYVSRGVLRRRRAPDGRGSLFDRAEVGELARRSRPRHPPSPGDLVIRSALTTFVDERPFYRGIAVATLAMERSLEDVATLLWTGELPEGNAPTPSWHAPASAVAAGVAAQAGLPPATLPLERLQVVVPALAATDHLRLHLEAAAITVAAPGLIAGMVDCLPDAPAAAARAPDGRIATGASITDHLWPKLCPAQLPVDLRDTLRAALVLLADHELAASTLAARVAASVHADPYAVVSAGLGAVSGAMHGGASLGAETMLTEIAEPEDAPRAVGERLRRGERIPGFGHLIYKRGDPRATVLLDLLRDRAQSVESAGAVRARLAIAESVLAEVQRRRLPAPNIDFALATLATATGMIKGAGEAIFAVARSVGWIAHALEEYAHETPLRPRAVYTGPAPARP